MGIGSTDDDTRNEDLLIAFKKIDIDGSGEISKNELRKQVGELGGKGDLTKEEFDAIFDVIDKDQSGAIDFDEYSSFVTLIDNKGKRSKRSSMKHSTQEDSLRNIMTVAQPTPPKANKPSMMRRKSTDMLRSTHRQASFTKSRMLDLDSELEPKVKLVRSSSLRFFDVEVREYDITASDNPCVSSGVAMELGWDYSVLDRLHLDTFEEKRSNERSKNFKKEKRLSKMDREKVLREFGATTKDIQEAAKRATIIRNKRMKSIGVQRDDKKHENWENRLIKIKKIFSFRKKTDKSTPEVDIERLHPTLMAMLGMEGTARSSSSEM